MNYDWTRVAIKELIHQGVRTFCISPGSHSAPLAISASEQPLAETIVHYDERGLGYFALGIAKKSKKAVAIIVTSGTAVGNLLPPVMEAYHDHIPLIVLTADRPPELQNSGANQTTDQNNIFSGYLRYQHTFPCPSEKISTRTIGSFVGYASSYALSNPQGPIQLNFMLRKPLYRTSEYKALSAGSKNGLDYSPKTAFLSGKLSIPEHEVKKIADELTEPKKGIILVSGTEYIDNELVYRLSRYLQWPVFPDILSSLRYGGDSPGVIGYYDLIVKALGSHEDFRPDAVLLIGDRLVSQKLMEWIALAKPASFIQISKHFSKSDPLHRITTKISAEVRPFITKLLEYIHPKKPSSWHNLWDELNQLATTALNSYFSDNNDFTEPGIFYFLKTYLEKNKTLFLSNSMPIRNAESFYFPSAPSGQIFANRGLSGIDGNIATIAGIAKASEEPVIGCVGDQSLLHDLNSLELIKKYPSKLILINNNGGDIFSFLAGQESPEVFEKIFTAPHNKTFENAAKLFGINYQLPSSYESLEEALNTPGPILIEAQTKPLENRKIHHEILKVMQTLLSSTNFKADLIN